MVSAATSTAQRSVRAANAERSATRVAGFSLIATCLGFAIAFQLLASRLGYPDMLDLPASDVLPRLIAGGAPVRAIWMFYAALPLGLAVAALASFPLLRRGNLTLAVGALSSGLLSAAAMCVGLMRWPTLQWRLAQAYESADAAQRALLSAAFDAANLYLGNAIGELSGELLLACFFALSGFALRQVGHDDAAPIPRWLWLGAVASAALFALGALRILTPVLQPVADFNNVWLAVWLIAHGVGLLRVARAR